MSITTRAEVRWVADQELTMAHPGSTAIHVDGHAKTGPSPIEALLGAAGACAAIDVVEIMAKRRTPVTSLEVDVEGERVDTHPRRLTRINLTFRIAGAGIDLEQAQRAVELSITRYCSVGASLDPAIKMEWTVQLQP